MRPVAGPASRRPEQDREGISWAASSGACPTACQVEMIRSFGSADRRFRALRWTFPNTRYAPRLLLGRPLPHFQPAAFPYAGIKLMTRMIATVLLVSGCLLSAIEIVLGKTEATARLDGRR